MFATTPGTQAGGRSIVPVPCRCKSEPGLLDDWSRVHSRPTTGIVVLQSSGLTPVAVGSPSSRYELFDELASGGMAKVRLARVRGSAGFSRIVAVKQLHPHLASDREFVSMFTDEARLCSRIRHPNVVPTLDVVEADGSLLLVMEYVHGVSLSELRGRAREQGELLHPGIVAAIVAEVLHGLHAAHEATDASGAVLHIVHRDVSPQNVLVGADGVARVVDFGVAKAIGRQNSTRDGQLKGKVAYMSPEQVCEQDVDRRTDVFAAAVVLWEALTGQRLFAADSAAAVINKVVSEPIRAPSEVAQVGIAGERIPPGLDAVVLRGLERNRELRFQTAREMALALEAALPLPPQTQVAELVERLASATLAKRRELLARAEASAGTPAPAPSNVGEQRAGLDLDATASVALVGPRGPTSTGGGRRVAPVAAALVALATLAFWGWSRSTEPVRATSATAIEPSSATPTTSRAAESVARAPALAASLAPLDASVAPPAHAPSITPQSSPKKLARKAVSKPARDCNPPYVIDPATGHRRIKPECL